jgi:tetratricopeptide (TPR) repeat protein
MFRLEVDKNMGSLDSAQQYKFDVRSRYNILLLKSLLHTEIWGSQGESSLKTAIKAADRLLIPSSEVLGDPRRLLRPGRPALPEQVGALLHRARATCPKDWRLALQDVEVARVGLMRLRVGPRLRNCFNGYATAIEANALRIQEQLAEADDYLDKAARLLESGSGALDATAYFLSIRASTEKDAWRLESAVRSAEAAALCFLRLEDEVQAAFALMNLAEAQRASGHWSEAASQLQRAEGLLPTAHPTKDLLFMVRALILADLGRAEEASFELGQCQYKALESPVWKSRFHWAAGVVARETGSYEKARKHLLRALEDFQDTCALSTVAPVTLDLALVELASGRTEELRALIDRLAAQTLREDFPQPLMTCVWALRQACFQKSVTAAAIRALRRQLFTLPLKTLRQPPS